MRRMMATGACLIGGALVVLGAVMVVATVGVTILVAPIVVIVLGYLMLLWGREARRPTPRG